MKRGTATGVVAALLGLLVQAGPVRAAGPPVPSGRLDAAQEQRLNEVLARHYRAAVAGQAGEALRLIQEQAMLRQLWLGPRHWTTVEARLQVERWQRRARLSPKHQKQLGESIRLDQEGGALGSRGRHREAEKARREALAIRLRVLGEEHPDTAITCNNLAHSLEALGKHAEALALYQKAVAICRKTVGQEHPDLASTYLNLGSLLSRQGKDSDALPYLQKGLAIFLKALGEEHPIAPVSYRNLVGCLTRQGKHRDALPLYQKVLLLRRRMLGEQHPDTAVSYQELATCLTTLGDQADALPLACKALLIWRQVRGDEHPDTARGYMNVAFCLHRQGRHADALPLFEKAFRTFRAALGEEHADTARTGSFVALCLSAQGQPAAAFPLFDRALRIRYKVLGPEHPDTAASYHNLAQCLVDQGKPADALPLYHRALAIQRKQLGEEHPLTTITCNGLAICLGDLGRDAAALRLHYHALAINRQVRGEEHLDTACTYHNTAFCLEVLGKYADAVTYYHRALAIHRKVLGEAHPHTATLANNLAYCRHRQGKHREAIRDWQAALLGHEAGRLGSATSGFERSLFRARALSPRLGLAVTHALLNEADRAWQHAEADLARGLLDDLASSADQHDHGPRAQLQQLEQQLLPLLGLPDLSTEQKRRRNELSRQRREVQARLSKLATDRSTAAVWSLERIQKQVPTDAALVLWLDVFDQHWACVLRREGPPRWQRLPGSGSQGAWTDDDLNLTQRLYEAVTDFRGPAARRERLVEAVRRQRLAPLAEHLRPQGSLPAVRRLLVVPTGAMARAPVEILAPGYTVSYVPSGTVLARLGEQHRRLKGDTLLALGDPVFTRPATAQSEPPNHGLLVKVVVPGGPASRAGLRPGDVLLSVGKRKLDSVDDLNKATASLPAAAAYWRDGKQHSTRLASGRLGIVVDERSARAAVRAWRRNERSARRDNVYQALPGTRLEVESLARLVPRATVLLGSRASTANLEELARHDKLRPFQLLHLATHGQVDDGRPEQSALILAQDRLPARLDEQTESVLAGRKPPDGRLTVGIILRDWKLDADLVVLSACQSGLGQDTGGNGLLGFAQALLSRGARSVVLSRWKVDDAATALLVVRFYENLLGKRVGLKEHLPRAAALAEAKKWLRTLPRRDAEHLVARLAGGQLRGTVDEALPQVKGKPAKVPEGDRPFAHPYYWAAFVLIGDPF
jgi:CHAT domain-containing protein/tetratricopeptide (TPR) repeat protein